MNFLNIKIELFTKKIQLSKKKSPPLKKLEEKIEKNMQKYSNFQNLKNAKNGPILRRF
jgi:hypothetical protein